MKPNKALRRFAPALVLIAISGAALPALAHGYSSCSTPTGLQGTAVSPTDVHLSWQASLGCSGPSYQVYRDGSSYASAGTALAWDDVNVAAGSTHTYQVRACRRHCSALSTPVTVTTPQPPPPTDTTPPTVPSGLHATAGDGQVSLSWAASTDPDSSVAGYDVYRNGTQVASTVGTSYVDTGLNNGTSYTYTVAAVDPSGNTSAQSTPVSATPQAAAPPPSSGPCGTASSAPSGGYQHVVWVVMENHSYGQIVGNSQAPYENQLASQCGLATNYHAISHPSLPNYIALTSGSDQGITDDNDPSSHPLDVPSIFSQLSSSGSRSLEESMPSNCAQSSSGEYAVKHNPEAYYTNLGTDCGNYDVPLGSTPDLSAKFTFVTPNLIDDMHDGTISQGDAWLQSFMSQVFQTPEWQAGNTAVFVTFDEDDGTSGNHVYTAVVAPSVKPGTQDATAFSHYSLLRTTEDLLGLPAIGNAATATGMEQAFNLGAPAPAPAPAPTPTPTPTAGACRSDLTPSSGLPFCLEGQAAPSPMNQPLPANPTIDPNSGAIVANLNSGQHNADISEFGTTVNDTANANTTVTLHCTEPWGTCSLEGQQVAVNTSWRPSWGSDAAMTIVDRSARKVYDLWQVATTSSGTINISNGTLSTSWGGMTSLDGNGQNDGATGSNLSHLFGMVRMFEIANATSSPSTAIGHALQFSSSFTCSTYRYPATKSDGGSSANCIPEGARVFLDSSADCASVTPAGAEAVCYALQKYGAYNNDSGGSPFAMGFEGDGVNDVPPVYSNVGIAWDYYDMSNIPWSHLHVAADCQCTVT